MKAFGRVVRVGALAAVVLTASGFRECYKPVKKSGLPGSVSTVAVPPFQNQALRYKIESRFTDAVAQELIRRGRGLRVQSRREGADLVVDGLIKEFYFGGVLLDDRGRARIFEVTVVGAVTLRDQTSNRVLYDNQNYVYKGEFEFANDPRTFFNEEDPAVQRLARKFAEDLVSTLVNGFGVNEKE
jgi:Lipopolysaccharide-assembly